MSGAANRTRAKNPALGLVYGHRRIDDRGEAQKAARYGKAGITQSRPVLLFGFRVRKSEGLGLCESLVDIGKSQGDTATVCVNNVVKLGLSASEAGRSIILVGRRGRCRRMKGGTLAKGHAGLKCHGRLGLCCRTSHSATWV
jgi:hypothetical protein